MGKEHSKETAKKLAASVMETAAGFEDWLEDHEDLVAGSIEPVSRETATLRRRAKKIARACDRPMAVAVYGGSQTGKSYLVSTLAKGGTAKKIQISLDGKEYDFLEEINPGGDRESTGLVTRFSVKPPATAPDKPVSLELLSELDIVSIFVNTFYGDIQHKTTAELAPEIIEKKISDAEKAAAGSASINHLETDDIIDFKEYLERYIEDQGKLRALVPGVWKRLGNIIPKLPTTERVKLYSLLWLEDENLTKACLALLSALESLGFSETATASINALIPRDTSIIDVENLGGFATEDEADIKVQGANGRQVNLGRARLCALTAELYLTLASSPGGVFDFCDLLDFPGARTRLKAKSVKVMIDTEENSDSKLDGLSRLYLRGKVDFLFKRYTFNQELAAVLLCMQPGNQEVHELKDTIYDWISTTLGGDPKARDKRANTLFVLFTKFDLTIQTKTGGHNPDVTLGIPIKNALVNFFNHNSKGDNWPSQWNSNGAFKNCHWYRNPFAVKSALFEYDADRKDIFEKDINPSEEGRISKFKKAFLASKEVNRYFFEPVRAWDSAMGIQDGGVSHIKERLDATVDSSTKFDQLEDRITELAVDLKARMERYHVSSDAKQEMEKRLKKAKKTLGAVVNDVIGKGMFGSLISRLQLSSSDILYDLQASINRRHQNGNGSSDPSAASELMENLSDIFGDPEESSASSDNDLTSEEASARELMQRWTSHMQDVIGDEKSHPRLSISAEHLQNLVAEIIQVSDSKNLENRIADLIKDHTDGPGGLEGYRTLSLMIADELNAFTFYLGYDRSEDGDRPVLAKSGTPIYSRPYAKNMDQGFEVTEDKTRFNSELYESWVLAMWTRIKESAAKKGGSSSVDLEANNRLKDYIDQIEDAATAT